MVGTSPAEIRKTYQHWIKEKSDRLRKVQEAAWEVQGIDVSGTKAVTVR